MRAKTIIIRTLAILGGAALSLQMASAQGASGGQRGGTQANYTANGQEPAVTNVLRAAADALHMPRWAQLGGGFLPDVDVINTMEFWASGTPYANYHVSLAYNPPAMRVEASRSSSDKPTFEVVSGKFAWDESELGGGLIPGKGTATPMPAAAKERELQLWILPFGVVKSAIAAGDKTKISMENGSNVITYPLMGDLAGVTVKATLDAMNLITKIETQSSDPALVMEAEYADYKDRGEIPTDVPFPGHIVLRKNGKTALDVQVKMADCNDPYLVFPVPDNVEKNIASGD